MVWMNTGAAFPESLDLIDKIRRQVPHFVEVKADVLADVELNGHPVDVLPINSTALAQLWSGAKMKMRPYTECCSANMWTPLAQKMKELGVTTIIRGQRIAEHYKSPLRDGAVIDGIKYEFPIQDWSDADVFAYLSREGVEIPGYYDYTGTSLDCWNCTAYLDAKLGQLKYMEQFHSEKHRIVKDNLTAIHAQITKELAPLNEAVRM